MWRSPATEGLVICLRKRLVLLNIIVKLTKDVKGHMAGNATSDPFLMLSALLSLSLLVGLWSCEYCFSIPTYLTYCPVQIER